MQPGDVSKMPYGEPTWLTPEFKSPYYKDSHRALQKVMRKFVDEVVYPDAQACEESGKRASKEVMGAMAANGLNRMRLGPGKHLHGQTLMDGVVKGEEFDYFQCVYLDSGQADIVSLVPVRSRGLERELISAVSSCSTKRLRAWAPEATATASTPAWSSASRPCSTLPRSPCAASS